MIYSKKKFSFIQNISTDITKFTATMAIIKNIIDSNSNWLGKKLYQFTKTHKSIHIVTLYRGNHLYFEDKIFTNVQVGDRILIASLDGNWKTEIRHILKTP